jgi:UV excision repair protein RAD23
MLEVEAEPTDTIGALKGKIQAANADLAAERQKLIYKGMVLKDTEIVGDLDIASNPDAYMVCMLAKVKAAKPAAAAAPAATAAAAPANTVEASAAGTSATAPAPAPVAAPAPAPAAAPAAQQEYVFVFRYSIVLPSFLVHDGLYVSLIHLLLLACTL